MTISISGTASGSSEHKLELVQNGAVRQSVDMGASFSTSVWLGAPLILREKGDTTSVAFFKFDHKQLVKVDATGQTGTVRGRSDNIDLVQKSYCVRHVDGKGDEVDVWFNEDQLSAA